jgi:hypothetical protein
MSNGTDERSRVRRGDGVSSRELLVRLIRCHPKRWRTPGLDDVKLRQEADWGKVPPPKAGRGEK